MHVRCLAVLLVLFTSWQASPAAAETTDLKASFKIAGKVPDMQQSTSSSGYTFRIDFREIRYNGQVQRTLLEPKESGRMTIWVALRGAVLTIHSTEISGGRLGASCGPLQLVLGNRRELWVALDVERKIVDNVEKLVLTGSRFGLTPDNWSVGKPEWVRTRGFGMSQSKVVNGLQGGLANNMKGVQQQLVKAAPQIYAQVENELAQNDVVQQVSFK
jgi:hypothetical protein